jgi:hypothetical protein
MCIRTAARGAAATVLAVANDELTSGRFSPRSGLGWAPVVCLLPAWLVSCYPDVVEPGPYEIAEDAGAVTAPSETSVPAATTLPDAAAGAVAALDAGLQSTVPSDAGPPEAGLAPASPCDLSGRWIASEHEVLNGLGAQEAAHFWYYFELSQTGGTGTVTKGLFCGNNVTAISSLGANETDPKAWPSFQAKVQEAGRTFTSTAAASGCSVSFEQFYSVIGATVPYYLDPTTTMPTASQQATSTTPGWEDWDDDGNPGITENSTGLVTGQLYLCNRWSTVWSGAIAASAPTFQLSDNWTTDPDDLGYSGSSLLTTQAGKDSDESLQFVQFARLSATQATGDDDSICTAIRSLAPSLTPSGAGN